ncbi:unnamed protein product [Polarella glacialis]|uniref:BTB domain-containing protein n=1 Tax=Polarella glacialis TaxID=89957 RepID=A0A813D7F9_POLGL|nr:unnamed protein product [Polarella glacialis]CAE8696712.1 unnamed protein product [Polarella glacialis]
MLDVEMPRTISMPSNPAGYPVNPVGFPANPVGFTANPGVFLAESTSRVLEVNVGGRIFTASSATLRKSPYLESLMGDELTDDLRDPEGRLFIDRDPEIFAEVLRLMRGHAPRALPPGELHWAEVRAEADFFQIPLNQIEPPVEVVLPPDVLSVRRLYVDDQPPPATTASGGPDELCMYTLSDLPPDFKSQTSIVGVEVDRRSFVGTKTVFLARRQLLQEAGFCFYRPESLWERTERRVYHRLRGTELVVPKHPTEVSRERTEHYMCITYAVPPVSPVVTAGDAVVGVLHPGRMSYDRRSAG